MSSAALIRLSGLSLLLGGLLAVVSLITLMIDQNVSGMELTNLLSFVSVLLVLLGLPGLYASQAERAGVLGLIGTVVVFFCSALLDGTHDAIGFIVRPALATIPGTAPLLPEGGPLDSAMEAGVSGTIVSVAGPLFLLGLILLGIATIRAGVLPRWTGALLIVAALLVPLGLIMSLEDIAFTLPYVALGCLGLVLAAGSRRASGYAEPVSQAR